MNKLSGALLVMFALVLVACNKPETDVTETEPNSQRQEVQMEETESNMDMESESEEMNFEGEAYEVNKEESSVIWSGSKITGSGHTGDIQIKTGEFYVDEGVVTGGSFVLDMTTIMEEGKQSGAIAHLKSGDFFEVETYPESKLVLKSVTPDAIEDDGSGVYNVVADLTIKDNTNEISFPANVTVMEDSVMATAEFSIDRTKWDVTFGSDSVFDDLGDQAILDMLDFEVEIVAAKK